MTLFVTRQNQEFTIGSDLQLADVHLTRSSIELVGEPGWTDPGFEHQIGHGHVGGAYDTMGTDKHEQSPTYGSTVNELYALNLDSSSYKGAAVWNGIEHKSTINHGWADVRIGGMTQNHQFMQDDGNIENQMEIVLPTDSGLVASRSAQQNGPPTDILLENVKLQQKIRVRTNFVGTAPLQRRVARFVEDFADQDPATYRDSEGSVRYFGSGRECQLPANLISCMILQFKIKPRTQL